MTEKQPQKIEVNATPEQTEASHSSDLESQMGGRAVRDIEVRTESDDSAEIIDRLTRENSELMAENTELRLRAESVSARLDRLEEQFDELLSLLGKIVNDKETPVDSEVVDDPVDEEPSVDDESWPEEEEPDADDEGAGTEIEESPDDVYDDHVEEAIGLELAEPEAGDEPEFAEPEAPEPEAPEPTPEPETPEPEVPEAEVPEPEAPEPEAPEEAPVDPEVQAGFRRAIAKYKEKFSPAYWAAKWTIMRQESRNRLEINEDMTPAEQQKIINRRRLNKVLGASVWVVGVVGVSYAASKGLDFLTDSLDATPIASTPELGNVDFDFSQLTGGDAQPVTTEDLAGLGGEYVLMPGFDIPSGGGGERLMESLGVDSSKWYDIAEDLYQQFPDSFYKEGGDVRISNPGALPNEVQQFIIGRLGL